ncbi:dicer-like protein 4 isoform X2 [Miscanthus floridulus]|uniref:dicer-like protein 4 isoform X2 n=1 Tax=Miscanthus floridulus TaxID=154761 RepID=UPI0034592476
MEPPKKHKSSGVPVKEEVESEDGNDLLVKRRRTEASGSTVQLQQQIEVFGMENKASSGLPVEDSTGKAPMDVLSSCAVQNSGQANGCRNESATSRLLKICKAIGWKEPSYDFEEQGPQHSKIFKCKVTVHLDGLLSTIMECFSDPKPKKKAARENAAQGALWCLKRSGYVK